MFRVRSRNQALAIILLAASLLLVVPFFTFLSTPFQCSISATPLSCAKHPVHVEDMQSLPGESSFWPTVAVTETSFPTTCLPQGAHVNGFTVFNNLYLRNGTFFVVSLDSSTFPSREAILSAPLDLSAGPERLVPTDEHLRYIDIEEAEQLLGHNPLHIDDTTVIVYDTNLFLRHYYHWWGEIVLGFWRVYSMINEPGPLPFPSRFMLPLVDEGQWRDQADINGLLLRAIHPSVSVETSDQWNDFIRLDRTVIFKRVAMINRGAAHRHPDSARYNKMIAPAMGLETPSSYWKPLQAKLTQNLLGKPSDSHITQETAKSKPVVTYISRQKTGRRLADKDHEALIRSLSELQDEGFCEVEIPVMENMSVKEQIELVSRSTIMLGVHGNGLTHQLWMPSSPWSTVIEIFAPGGYFFDYRFLSRSVGHRHYAVWNDTFVTEREAPKAYTEAEGMQGNEIPVHGPGVIDLIRQRLATHPTFRTTE